ncbi:hypothetical protein L0657_05440 [Dyadobacter sp. CY345]|uniref:hypothetical protein n=1 Tax=Dyadobacter sp. CY345 TaxID=2909335 RepID=UPI001F295F1C|nr:hypothetical protein [Dyadobacter sp. CY345]MCF2443392.1 hypothetical protein [Dyadobacter sp. CY345]
MIKFILFVSILISTVSCQKDSADEKMVNALFEKIQANWTLTSFKLEGPGSDTLDFSFNSGHIKWNSCKYTDQGRGSELCAGDFSLNNVNGSLSYLYDLEKKTYRLRLGVGTDLNWSEQLDTYKKIIGGEWTLEVLGDNILMATQLQNDRSPGLKISFMAKK